MGNLALIFGASIISDRMNFIDSENTYDEGFRRKPAFSAKFTAPEFFLSSNFLLVRSLLLTSLFVVRRRLTGVCIRAAMVCHPLALLRRVLSANRGREHTEGKHG